MFLVVITNSVPWMYVALIYFFFSTHYFAPTTVVVQRQVAFMVSQIFATLHRWSSFDYPEELYAVSKTNAFLLTLTSHL